MVIVESSASLGAGGTVDPGVDAVTSICWASLGVGSPGIGMVGGNGIESMYPLMLVVENAGLDGRLPRAGDVMGENWL